MSNLLANPSMNVVNFDFLHNCNNQFMVYKQFIKNSNELSMMRSVEGKLSFINAQTPNSIYLGEIWDDLDGYIQEDLCKVGFSFIGNTKINLLCSVISTLTAISAAMRGRVILDLDDNWKEAGILQALAIANSGDMKSHLEYEIAYPFKKFEDDKNSEYNPEEYDFCIKAAKKNQKRLITSNIINNITQARKIFKEQKNFLEGIEEISKYPHQLLCSSSTNYGLSKDLLHTGGSIFYISPEPTGLEQIIKSSYYELLLKGYGLELYIRHSGRGSITIPYPAISLLVFCQLPFALKLASYKHVMACGLSARWLPIFNNQTLLTKSFCDKEREINIYREKIKDILNVTYTRDINAERFIMRATQDAVALLKQFQNYIASQSMNHTVKIWAAKAHGQAARIALAIHAWNHGSKLLDYPVSLEEVKQAINLIQIIFRHASFLFGDDGFIAQRHAIKIFESLQRINNINEQNAILAMGTTTTKLHQRTGLSNIQVNEALRYLENTGWIATWDNGGSNLLVRLRNDFFWNFNKLKNDSDFHVVL